MRVETTGADEEDDEGEAELESGDLGFCCSPGKFLEFQGGAGASAE